MGAALRHQLRMVDIPTKGRRDRAGQGREGHRDGAASSSSFARTPTERALDRHSLTQLLTHSLSHSFIHSVIHSCSLLAYILKLQSCTRFACRGHKAVNVVYEKGKLTLNFLFCCCCCSNGNNNINKICTPLTAAALWLLLLLLLLLPMPAVALYVYSHLVAESKLVELL